MFASLGRHPYHSRSDVRVNRLPGNLRIISRDAASQACVHDRIHRARMDDQLAAPAPCLARANLDDHDLYTSLTHALDGCARSAPSRSPNNPIREARVQRGRSGGRRDGVAMGRQRSGAFPWQVSMNDSRLVNRVMAGGRRDAEKRNQSPGAPPREDGGRSGLMASAREHATRNRTGGVRAQDVMARGLRPQARLTSPDVASNRAPGRVHRSAARRLAWSSAGRPRALDPRTSRPRLDPPREGLAPVEGSRPSEAPAPDPGLPILPPPLDCHFGRRLPFWHNPLKPDLDVRF